MTLFLILICSFYSLAHSAPTQGTQRALTSSYQDYQQYLQKNKLQSFISAYIEASKSFDFETKSITQCMDALFIGKKSDDLCFEAVKNINARPLSESSRQVLISFLKKLRKFSSVHQKFYQEFEKGFSFTDPVTARKLGALPYQAVNNETFHQLEMKAWKRALEKKLLLSDSLLLINGSPVKLSNWQPPSGIFQWSLISNTHEPLIRMSTFSQFASESVRELTAFSKQLCPESPPEMKTFGLAKVQIFYDRKCILEKSLMTDLKGQTHLGEIQMPKKISSVSDSKHWIFPVLAIIGVGLVSELRGKSLSLSMP